MNARLPTKFYRAFVWATLLGWSALVGAANTAIEPVPREGNWPQRHESLVALSQAGGVDVMFVGDSITDRWRNEKGEKAVWDAEMAPLGAGNYGISGDRTQHGLWRLQNGELDGISPKVVVLMIGTNNTGYERNTTTPRNTVEEAAEGVKLVVQTLREKLPGSKILLLGIFPRGEFPDNFQRIQVAEINRLIAPLHDGKAVFYLNLDAWFLSPDGTLSKGLMPDFLHPGAAGYQLWADAIREPLKALLGEGEINWSVFAR